MCAGSRYRLGTWVLEPGPMWGPIEECFFFGVGHDRQRRQRCLLAAGIRVRRRVVDGLPVHVGAHVGGV